MALKRKLKVLILLIPVLIVGIIFILNNIGPNRDYRQDMRVFVQNLSVYAKGININFTIVPQNGQELLTESGEATDILISAYLSAIDGVGREDLYYGYTNDNIPTPNSEREYMLDFLDLSESQGIEVLVIDYCWTPSYMDDSYAQNAARGYISFAADHRELDNIPSYPLTPYNENSTNIVALTDAKNFLYLINPDSFANKSIFIKALQATNYDLLIIDLFFDGQQLNNTEVISLKLKANGGTRLVIAYMSIGEAEDYRYYWQPEWELNPPSWLAGENPNWPGNYKVRYWDPNWQQIIYGNDGSYLKKILDSGFNGVYLDIIDAFEYFE